MSRSALNSPSHGVASKGFLKPKGRGRRAPVLLPEGKTYGRLTATGLFEFRPRSDGRNRSYQRFDCSCGNYVWVPPSSVKNGNTESCGCLHTEAVKGRKIEVTRIRDGKEQTFTRDRNHGQSRTRLYRKWKSMHARCANSNSRTWKWYGGKGIQVDPSWADWETFESWARETGYQEGLELDRIDADRDYSPSNCRWITKRENVKRARSLLPASVGDLLIRDAHEQGKSVEGLIADIVIRHYTITVESPVSGDSPGPSGPVTDRREV